MSVFTGLVQKIERAFNIMNMNTVINDFYRAIVEDTESVLNSSEINEKWDALCENASEPLKNEMFNEIGGFYSLTTRTAFEAGFKSAIRFLMNV